MEASLEVGFPDRGIAELRSGDQVLGHILGQPAGEQPLDLGQGAEFLLELDEGIRQVENFKIVENGCFGRQPAGYGGEGDVPVLAQPFRVGLGLFGGQADERPGGGEVRGREPGSALEIAVHFINFGIGLLGRGDLVPGRSIKLVYLGIPADGLPKERFPP